MAPGRSDRLAYIINDNKAVTPRNGSLSILQDVRGSVLNKDMILDVTAVLYFRTLSFSLPRGQIGQSISSI